MDIIVNILLGALGSIVATIVLYLCSSLYKFGYKDDVLFNIDKARVAVYQIENQHTFPEDYALVIEQVDILHQCVYDIYRSLHPLTMIKNYTAKKLIITLIYDIICSCERAKFLTVGFSGLAEKEARLEEIHRVFYKYTPLDERNSSTVIVQIDIIENLFNGKDIKESINDAIGNMADTNPMEDLICGGFININSFRLKNDVGIRKKCFSRDEFKKVMR